MTKRKQKSRRKFALFMKWSIIISSSRDEIFILYNTNLSETTENYFITQYRKTMEFEWIVIKITEAQTVGQKWSQVRAILVEEDSNKEYKNSIGINFWNKKIGLVDDITVGDKIIVSFNTSGYYAEKSDKIYTNANWWKIEKLSSWSLDDDIDDLPF